MQRFDSIRPAVFAHALSMSALNLVHDPDALIEGPFWAFTAIKAAALAAAAALLAPRTVWTGPQPSATSAA